MIVFGYILMGLFCLIMLYVIVVQFLVSEAIKNRFAIPRSSKKQPFDVQIFFWVVRELKMLAKFLNLNYFEVNILVYYILVPLSWCFLLDWYLEIHYFTVGFVLLWICVLFIYRDFARLSKRMYKKSVGFLLLFNRFGSNYLLSSVVICVGIPLVVYGVLVNLVLF
ncbi:MAG: hypothetical protein FJX80_16440 [Bacteroidetes bacterium]|nr:hypothetical protein [Bacteroidota bacterium]